MSKTVKTAPAKPTPSTTDAGRVHVGGGMMRYSTAGVSDAAQVKDSRRPTSQTVDAGRVHVGGGMMRF